MDDELLMESSGQIVLTKAETGIVKVKVYAIDEYGNTSVKETSVIFVDDSDKTAPTALIQSPEHADTISGIVKIIGSAYDENEMLRYRLQYKQHDAETFVTFAEMYSIVENGTLGSLNTETLQDGVYDIRLTVEDKSGNVSYIQYSYIVNNNKTNEASDTIKPVIDIAVSQNQAEIGDEVSCIISVMDNQELEAVKVYLDDELVLTSNGNFRFTRSEACVSRVKVYAVDKAGNYSVSTAECLFIDNRDKTAPIAEISNPAHASEISGAVFIEGTAKDETAVLRYILQYRLQGTDEFITFAENVDAVEKGQLGVLDTTKLLNGVYEIRLTVEDKGGNSSYIQYSYVVNNETEGSGEILAEDEKDIVDPVIRLALSKTNAPVNETVKANIIVTDNQAVKEVRVLVNGKEVEYQGNKIEFTSDKVGKTTIEVIAKDSSGNTATKSTVCNFYNSSDKKAPELDIISPEHDATLSVPTAIVGSVYDETELAYYTVEYRLKGEKEYTLLTESSEEKHNETLAVFDTTVLANGVYEIKVSAFDNGGNMSYMTGQYVVEGNLKIGNLNLGFEDLDTTISGVQVAASRYYSSANKKSGDFGVGWSLGISSIHLYEMNEMNNYWDMPTSGFGLFSTYSLQETASHDVVITYGDGTSERFKAKLTKDTQKFAPITNTSIVFESPENSKNKLEILGN